MNVVLLALGLVAAIHALMYVFILLVSRWAEGYWWWTWPIDLFSDLPF